MTVDTLALIRSFLAGHTTLVLSTLGEDGRPQTAPLFYAETEAFDLVFISESKTAHIRNIARDPRVAGSIAADDQDWHTIQGLQFEGLCSQLSAETARLAHQVYTARYPFIIQNPILKLAFLKTNFYQIRPAWMRLVDNTRGFGTKLEVRF